MSEIRVAVRADETALAGTLADAFEGDPVWDWMLPERNRRRKLEAIFGALLRHAMARGQVHASTDLRAVTMWAPPGQWRVPVTAMLKSAGPIVRAAGLRLPRLLGRLAEIEKLHAAQPPDPRHWYLEFIGTAAAAQGGGLGSALLADALQRYDQAGMPVYLESSNPRNLPFYQRHGFHILGRHEMTAGPPQWTLWRPTA